MGIDENYLRAAARRNTNDDRTRNLLEGCGRRAIAGDVTIMVNEDGSTSRRGVLTCQLVNLCARCGSHGRGVQAERTQRRIEAWQALGYTVVLMTFTVGHTSSDPLAEVSRWLTAGRRAVLGGSTRRHLHHVHGLRHVHRRVEYGWSGRSGWHPHEHLLLFISRAMTQTDVDALHDDVRARYVRATTRAGAPDAMCTNDHAVDTRMVQNGDAGIVAAYITKETHWNDEVTGVYRILADLAAHERGNGMRCECARCKRLQAAWNEFVGWSRTRRRHRFAEPLDLDRNLASLGAPPPSPPRSQGAREVRTRVAKQGWGLLVAHGRDDDACAAAATGGYLAVRHVTARCLIDDGFSVSEAAVKATLWVRPARGSLTEHAPDSVTVGPAVSGRLRRWIKRLGRRCP